MRNQGVVVFGRVISKIGREGEVVVVVGWSDMCEVDRRWEAVELIRRRMSEKESMCEDVGLSGRVSSSVGKSLVAMVMIVFNLTTCPALLFS